MMSSTDGPVHQQATQEMVKSFITETRITDFRIPFITYADIIKKLRQASKCLMSVPDFWLDTSTWYGK